MKKLRKCREKKEQRILRKIAFLYSLVLFGVLIVIVLAMNHYFVNFIKGQRVEHNTQLLHKAAYEMKEVYSKFDYLLVQLCNQEKFSIDNIKLSVEGESTFEKIKREVDFVERVKDIAYTNGLGELYKGILFFDTQGYGYYMGDGVLNMEFPFGKIKKGNTETNVMQLVGPISEKFLRYYSEDKKVFAFVKRAEANSQVDLEQQGQKFAMITVELDKMMNILENGLLEGKNYFVTNQNDEIIYSKGIKNKGNQDKLIVTSVEVDAFGWKISMVDEPSILFRDIYTILAKVLGMIVIGAILSIFLFLLISKKILFPIAVLKNMLHQVAEDSNTYLEVVSNDEVGEISDLINNMKKKIKNLTENQYYLEMKTTEARMQVLQAQINPHFLYNTLDNIYCISQIEEIEPISVLTRNLSEMLRYSINTKQMFVSLEEEIQYVKSYLSIINIRYEDRVKLYITIDEAIKNCQVFKLLLQPIVENACLHGILPSTLEKGEIYIVAQEKDGDIEIEVKNNGIILSDEELLTLNTRLEKKIVSDAKRNKKGFGIALENINERLNLYYGKEYGMLIKRIDHWGTCVRVKFKFDNRRNIT